MSKLEVNVFLFIREISFELISILSLIKMIMLHFVNKDRARIEEPFI
jgi:hypothetical protein